MSISNMNMKQKTTKKKNNQDGFILRFLAIMLLSIYVSKYIDYTHTLKGVEISVLKFYSSFSPIFIAKLYQLLVFIMFNVDACGSCKVKGALK